MSRPLAAAVLTALLIVALPATADAKTYRGKTSQGKGVTIRASGGYISRVTTNWRADCDHGLKPYSSATVSKPGSGDRSDDGMNVNSPYTVKYTHGVRGRFAVHVRITRAGAGWRGDFSVTARFRANGRLAATCRAAFTLNAGTATPAGPAKRFVGASQQRRLATVVTRADGVVSHVQIAWHAGCGHDIVFDSSTFFRNGLDVQTADAVADTGTYSYTGQGVNGRERFRVSIAVAGRHILDPAHPELEHWSGKLQGKVAISKRGKLLRRCTLKPVSWSAAII